MPFAATIGTTSEPRTIESRWPSRASGAPVRWRVLCVRHLVLAIVLMPVLFLGVFLVTRLVEADLANWRLAERRAA